MMLRSQHDILSTGVRKDVGPFARIEQLASEVGGEVLKEREREEKCSQLKMHATQSSTHLISKARLLRFIHKLDVRRNL